MRAVHKLMRALLEEADSFPAALKTILREDLKVSVVEFAEASGIPQPTIYKLLSGEHEPNLRTVRLCVRAILKLEGESTAGFVAVVAPQVSLARLNVERLSKETSAPIKEYPAATVEDALIQGVWAERDGAIAIVTNTLEAGYLRRAVTIDVLFPEPSEGIETVVRRAAERAREKQMLVARASAEAGP